MTRKAKNSFWTRERGLAMTGAVALILTTLPNADAADALAQKALQSRTAACATRLAPARSQYFWQGKLAIADEVPLLFKTSALRVHELEQLIAANHPYGTPEILIWETAATSAYAQWVESETCRKLHV